MGLRPLEILLLLQLGDRFLTSESDVYGNQILNTVGPRAVRVKTNLKISENNPYLFIHLD